MFAGAALLSLAMTAAVLRQLRRRAILDMPNHRSSHAVPTPRGGGLGVIAALLSAWTALTAWGGIAGVLSMTEALTLGLVIALAGLLAGLSWIDDLHSLSARLRLGVQAGCVVLVLALLPADLTITQGLLPLWADRVAAALVWLWFINLYNFLDGIDGLAGSETACLGLGLALLAVLGAAPAGTGPFALVVAGAGAGFLALNWQPARVFLGDVGSIALGFVLGWLLLLLAVSGAWAAALILPAYYWADATWTLLCRIRRRARIWQAHREHAYQRAVQNGMSHAAAVRRILALNLGLAALAVISTTHPWPALAAACAGTAAFLPWLARGRVR